MLKVKDLEALKDYGFKKERNGVYVYNADPFFLWVNPYFNKKFNRNQLVIEYFNDNPVDEISEYANDSVLNIVYDLIKADIVERG